MQGCKRKSESWIELATSPNHLGFSTTNSTWKRLISPIAAQRCFPSHPLKVISYSAGRDTILFPHPTSIYDFAIFLNAVYLLWLLSLNSIYSLELINHHSFLTGLFQNRVMTQSICTDSCSRATMRFLLIHKAIYHCTCLKY